MSCFDGNAKHSLRCDLVAADRLTLTKLFGRLSGVGLDPPYGMGSPQRTLGQMSGSGDDVAPYPATTRRDRHRPDRFSDRYGLIPSA